MGFLDTGKCVSILTVRRWTSFPTRLTLKEYVALCEFLDLDPLFAERVPIILDLHLKLPQRMS